MASDEWRLRQPPPDLERRYRDEGWWREQGLGELIDGHLRAMPEQELVVWSDLRPWRGAVEDVGALARRVAGGLRARGVRPGDVVAFQLPNWMEAAAVFWGSALAGATLVPVVHFYGARELASILRDSRARVLVTPERFGHLDYLAALDDLRSELPDLEHVLVVGDEPGRHERFDALAGAEPLERPVRVHPADPVLVAFTSGTTSEPKGVVHTHRSVAAEVRQLAGMEASGDVPMLVGAPVGHAIGMLSGLLLPLHRGHPIHLIDAWDPARVLEIMRAEHLNGGNGATFFLTSLLDHPSCGPEHLELMGHVGLGGAPVPAAVSDRAEKLGISVIRSFGTTEHPSVTGSGHGEPAEKRKYTDGRALDGVEVRLVDDDGTDVGPGEPGEILSRGPDLFAGYTDPALTDVALDRDGWYHTGDIGILDSDGYLSITDRKSDVIIRGGENVSAAEVEDLLARLPGVAEVAVVAAPDERLGEHACAVVRPADPGGGAPDLEAVRRHLEASGLARQKWPEEIRERDDLPRTPSGKIKKYVLRAELREETTPEGGDGPGPG